MRLAQGTSSECASSVCVHQAGSLTGPGAHPPSPRLPPNRARMNAAQCLAHPWLNNLAEKAKRCNRRLKSQILLKKYLMKRRWKVPGWSLGWEAHGVGRALPPGPSRTSPALEGSVGQALPCLENRAEFSLPGVESFTHPFILGRGIIEAQAQENVCDPVTGLFPSFFKYVLSSCYF